MMVIRNSGDNFFTSDGDSEKKLHVFNERKLRIFN